MTKRFLFPLHYDSDNRGCEGIAKGTANILRMPVNALFAYCSNIELDRRMGVDKYFTLISKKNNLSIVNKLFRKIELFFAKTNYDRRYVLSKYLFKRFFDGVNKSDIVFSTGGDMLCYQDNEVNLITDYLYRKEIKSILWGCSMGRNNLTDEKFETLKKFTLIYARETLTYDFFKSLGLKNVICLPDPAFVLEPQVTELPNFFHSNEVIGLNISIYTLGASSLETPIGIEICKSVEYIFEKTKLHVLLIPHVLWKNQDDRIVCKLLYEKFKDTKRIHILNSEQYNYLQLRYIISQCKFFIGARTHAVISAYSCCVPSIALGYSIKSKGIAKDLGLPEELVVDCKDTHCTSVLYSMCFLFDNYERIKKHLETVIPDYRKQPYRIVEYLP